MRRFCRGRTRVKHNIPNVCEHMQGRMQIDGYPGSVYAMHVTTD